MNSLMSQNDFITLVKALDIVDIVNKYSNMIEYSDLNEKIKAGCGNKPNLDSQYRTQNIFVQEIMGQVGRFSDCGGSCCSSGYSYSTWISALKRNTFWDLRQLLIKNPEYYYEKMKKPLEFFTIDNKTFYSTGCSRRAIVAKVLLTLHFDLTGINIPLKNVLVIRGSIPSNVIVSATIPI